MSAHAAAACAASGVPLVQLSRPAWRPQAGDIWHEVDNVAQAVIALGDVPKRVFLSHGKEIGPFAASPQHVYIIRTIDPPQGLESLPDHRLILARGPFDLAAETALLQRENMDVIVTKNSGGSATYAKIEAARALNIPAAHRRKA
eukprot:gene9485-9565_t